MGSPGQAYEGLTKTTANGPRWRGVLRVVDSVLEAPLHWAKPRMIFVNSMSDLFHEKVPLSFLISVFDTIKKAEWHTFQILTKRADRLREVAHLLEWPRNLWMGVSIESNEYVHRADDLRAVNASVRFLSLEPLLGPLPDLHLEGIHWAIVGGESGPGARPMAKEWVRDLRDRCRGEGIPFFFKQWGGVRKKIAGREIDGRTWDEFPPSKSAVTVAQSRTEKGVMPQGQLALSVL